MCALIVHSLDIALRYLNHNHNHGTAKTSCYLADFSAVVKDVVDWLPCKEDFDIPRVPLGLFFDALGPIRYPKGPITENGIP